MAGTKKTHQVCTTVVPSAPNRARNRCSSTPSWLSSGETALMMVEFQSKANSRPREMSTPKRAPKTPRSRMWNQLALTLTMETAPKLWKYMLRA